MNDFFSLLEAHLSFKFLSFKVLNESDFRLWYWICIHINQFHNLFHHKLLHLFWCLMLELYVELRRIVTTEISIQPNSHLTLQINDNLILSDWKTTDFRIYFTKARKHSFQTIKIIRWRNILKITQSGCRMLDVDGGWESRWA